MISPRANLLVLLGLCPFASFGVDAGSPATRGQADYEQKIKPLLEKYCFDCHADGMDKGDFTFDKFKDYPALRADKKFWDHARQQLVTHVMPPEKKERPDLQQRDAIVAWIDDAVFWYDPAKPDPGHATYRRLNRTEYNNTVRDLLMVDTKPANDFPPDDTGYGYDNIGDVLSLSPMLMEKYLRAAHAITDKAMDVGVPNPVDLKVEGKKFSSSKGETQEVEGVRWLNSNMEASVKVSVPVAGTYSLTLFAAATQAGDEPAKIALRINDKEISTHDVLTVYRRPKKPWQEIEQKVALKAGESKISVRFLNDFADPASADPNKKDRNVAIGRLQVRGPYGLTRPFNSKFVNWLFNGKTVGIPGTLLRGEDFTGGKGEFRTDEGGISLPSNGFVKHPVELAKAGKYRITIKAGAQQAGKEPAKFEVHMAGKTLASFTTAYNQAPQWFAMDVDLPAGQHDLEIWFTNDYYNEQTKEDRNFWMDLARVEGPLDASEVTAEDLPGLVARLGQRLFRRPMTDAEKIKWGNVAKLAVKEGERPLDAMRYVLEGMLVSPSFLFRSAPQPIGPVENGIALIDEYSLANRLAYFLWASPPDESLLQLAAKGELRKNLAQEIKRMVLDWRGTSLTQDFAGQWLQLRDMDIVSPDSKMFPDFTGRTSYMMKTESQMFFEYILKENHSVIEFINGDYTFLNEKLAAYYGIPGVKGDKFQKVALTGTPRGGILTQGSILTLTSGQTRTSPVKRGKYLLENILGTPPPPAPGGVPPLDETKVRRSKQTLREQFAQHREAPACAGCHAFLDPMGFAFENYDAVGRWRDKDKDNPVDASGQLIRGQSFKDLAGLREILARDMADEFTRNLGENLLTYALGRGLEHSDKPAIAEVVRRTKERGYKFQEMILAVCESVPFQKMRVGDGRAEGE